MQRGRDAAAEHAFPGLAGTDARRELVAAEAAAGEVRADVGRDDQQHQEQQQLRPGGVQAHQRQPRRHEHQQPGDRSRRAVDPRRRDRDPEQSE